MVEHTLEELMEEMREDEEQIQAHPCCANCIHCYIEYGIHLCKYEGDDVPASDEAWNPNTDVCHRWRSEMTGMPTRERQRLLEEGEREQARRSFYED